MRPARRCAKGSTESWWTRRAPASGRLGAGPSSCGGLGTRTSPGWPGSRSGSPSAPPRSWHRAASWCTRCARSPGPRPTRRATLFWARPRTCGPIRSPAPTGPRSLERDCGRIGTGPTRCSWPGSAELTSAGSGRRARIRRMRRVAASILSADFARLGEQIKAAAEPAAAVRRAGDLKMRPGIAVNPETPIESVFPHLEELDNVIVMTLARTGWAGQPFQESSLPKIEAVRREIDRRGLDVDVVVDGGIDEESAPKCLAAGATVLAAASSIFKADDPAEATARLAELARSHQP